MLTSSNPTISVANLSKRYALGKRTEKSETLRDAIMGALRAPFGKTERVNGGESFWALTDVNFEVKRGEVLGIIGRNGAGKSTVLKILSRITEPTTGQVKIRGRVASLLEVGTGFHPELSGRENIYLNGALLGMKRVEIKSKFDQIVAFAGIDKFLDTPVKRYSSGMYVRLAFAVAAHLEPEILIIDEVLAVGDAEFQKKCLGRIGKVAQEGRTVLFVSHNMVAVKAMCSRALLLRDGTVAAEGTPADVVDRYLGAGRISRAQVRWADLEKAPGTATFRFSAVRVRNSSGTVTSEISTNENFSVEVEYVNLSPGSSLGATILLYNSDGIHILSSLSNREQDWHGRRFPAGTFVTTCYFPGNLLPDARYEVSVIVWADNYRISHREDCIVEFQVYDSTEARGDYFGGWAGVVRPVLDWTTKQVTSSGAASSD